MRYGILIIVAAGAVTAAQTGRADDDKRHSHLRSRRRHASVLAEAQHSARYDRLYWESSIGQNRLHRNHSSNSMRLHNPLLSTNPGHRRKLLQENGIGRLHGPLLSLDPRNADRRHVLDRDTVDINVHAVHFPSSRDRVRDAEDDRHTSLAERLLAQRRKRRDNDNAQGDENRKKERGFDLRLHGKGHGKRGDRE